jgi:hypothetical protein
MLIYGTVLVLEFYFPEYYYRIGVLIAYIISIIFLLAGWADIASTAASILGWRYINLEESLDGSRRLKNLGAGEGAAAGVGAIAW